MVNIYDVVDELNDMGFKSSVVVDNINGRNRMGIAIKQGTGNTMRFMFCEASGNGLFDSDKTAEQLSLEIMEEFQSFNRVFKEMGLDPNQDPSVKQKEVFLEKISVRLAPTIKLRKQAVFKDTEFKGISEYLVCENVSGLPGKLLGKDSVSTMHLTNALLDHFGVNENEAFEQAHKNLSEKATIKDMAHILGKMGVPEVLIPKEVRPRMLVVSTTDSAHGGAAILCKDKICELAKDIDVEKFVALPSSVHEWILVPLYKDEEGVGVNPNNPDLALFSEMVNDVNMTEVDPEDRLASQSYLIDAHGNVISEEAGESLDDIESAKSEDQEEQREIIDIPTRNASRRIVR